mgnify:CR=1 FL=1
MKGLLIKGLLLKGLLLKGLLLKGLLLKGLLLKVLLLKGLLLKGLLHSRSIWTFLSLVTIVKTVHLCNNKISTPTTKASGLSNLKTSSISKLISNLQVHENNLVHLFEDMHFLNKSYPYYSLTHGPKSSFIALTINLCLESLLKITLLCTI